MRATEPEGEPGIAVKSVPDTRVAPVVIFVTLISLEDVKLNGVVIVWLLEDTTVVFSVRLLLRVTLRAPSWVRKMSTSASSGRKSLAFCQKSTVKEPVPGSSGVDPADWMIPICLLSLRVSPRSPRTSAGSVTGKDGRFLERTTRTARFSLVRSPVAISSGLAR